MTGLGFLLLAADPPAAAPDPMSGIVQMVPMFLMIGVLFFFMILRPQQREARARDEMLKGVKKNDRVLTTGGIYGVVTNVSPEANEVTIRVDERNDTKLRMALSSIARILTDAPSTEDKAVKAE